MQRQPPAWRRASWWLWPTEDERHRNDELAAAARNDEPPPPPHLQRGLQLARALRDGYWTARCANSAARHAAATGDPAVPPQQAKQLMQEAVAAESACRRLLPEAWLKSLEATGPAQEARACIDKHLQRGSLRAWIPSLVRAHPDTLKPTPSVKGGSFCAGCGKEGIGLRECAACRNPQERYCRFVGGPLMSAVRVRCRAVRLWAAALCKQAQPETLAFAARSPVQLQPQVPGEVGLCSWASCCCSPSSCTGIAAALVPHCCAPRLPPLRTGRSTRLAARRRRRPRRAAAASSAEPGDAGLAATAA